MDRQMPQDTLSFIQRLQEYGVLGYAWILFVSFWAGTAKYLTSLDGKKPTFFGWLSETCVSGFVGVIAAMTCQYYQMDFFLTAAITGICAHNGTRSLYIVGQMLKKNNPNLNQIVTEPSVNDTARMTKKKEQDDDSAK
ncbi:MAG: hypothetical protein GY840_16935 [Pseudoalteromonas sp.]|nr:hypothetical protein [Pseudoalteromonas sp.]